MQNPVNTLLEVSMMYAVPRCLHVIAEMGVADVLGDAPRTAEELAANSGADPDALARALRLLSAYGFSNHAKTSGAILHPRACYARIIRNLCDPLFA